MKSQTEAYQEYTFQDFISLDPIITIGKHRYVAIIGSRDIKENIDAMQFIRDYAQTLCYSQKCKVVTGGAYGPDEASMEGSIDAELFSLSTIIPLTPKKTNNVTKVFLEASGIVPMVDTIECVITTDRLIVYYPDFTGGYNVGKYFERDKKIARISDVVLAFWDGKSGGTKKTINYAKELKRKVMVVIVEMQ